MPKPKTEKPKKTRYEGKLSASSKRNRPCTYYKLTEADWPKLKKGLADFEAVYSIAAKIGCGYTTLKRYIAEHPELKEVQEERDSATVEVATSQLMKLIRGGSLGAICFMLERKGGWTNKQKIESDVPLPNIVLGVIPDEELPTEGEPLKLQRIIRHEEETAAEVEAEKAVERKEQEQTAAAEDTAEQARPPAVASDEGLDDDWGDDGDAPDIFGGM